jgi:hypothetical protein
VQTETQKVVFSLPETTIVAQILVVAQITNHKNETEKRNLKGRG